MPTHVPTSIDALSQYMERSLATTLVNGLKEHGFVVVREEELRLAPFEPLALPDPLPPAPAPRSYLPVDVLDA